MTTAKTQTWRKMRFADFVDTNPKSTLKKDQEYPFIPMELLDGTSKYPISYFTKKFTGGGSRFMNGDTVFARITPCLENGKIAQIKDLPDNVGFGSTEFFVFRGKEGISDKDFIYYLSRTDRVRSPAIKSMVGASGRQRADKSVVENLEILVPSISQQHDIVQFLSAYDDLIENNNRRIQILEKMAQAIYMEWFVNDPKFKSKKVKLSEVVKPQYGYTESASDKPIGPKYLRGTDINKQNFIDWSAVPYCKISDEDKKKYQLRKGDIVIIRMADPGKIGIVEQNIDGVFASYLIRLEIIDKCISPYYLFYFLNSSEYQNYIQGASGGTTRKSASAGVVTGTDIVIPPAELLGQFEEKISLLRSELNNLLNQNANLRQTRDLLLPKLVRGEIKI